MLEVIPTPKTDPAVVDFFMDYGDVYLGKKTVCARIHQVSLPIVLEFIRWPEIYQLTDELGLSLDAMTDKLTGPAPSRPKTGTFRRSLDLGDPSYIQT
ncbi:MAG: hypothetical protein R2784_02875 [Saprospiraceae bacterium]